MYVYISRVFKSLQNESGYLKLSHKEQIKKSYPFIQKKIGYLLTAVTEEKKFYKFQQLNNRLRGM